MVLPGFGMVTEDQSFKLSRNRHADTTEKYISWMIKFHFDFLNNTNFIYSSSRKFNKKGCFHGKPQAQKGRDSMNSSRSGCASDK